MTRPASEGQTPTSYNEQIIDSLSSGVLALDKTGRIITANRAVALHLRVEENAVRSGSHFERVFAIPPFVEAVHDIMAARAPVTRRELMITFDDGTRMELGLSASLLEGPETFNGVILQFADITERRNLERAAELSRQLATLGELTAGVVHELRNPVSVIGGMAELLIRRLPPGDDNRATAEIILDEAANIEKTIGQFLAFARPFELDTTHCYPDDISERALQLCRHRAQRTKVQVEYNPEAEPTEMRADVNRAGQAVANILTNAIEASPPGSTVLLRTHCENDYVVFEVMDEGPGIHVAPGEDIFSPFFTMKEGGTGLGLGIVHRIVTAHGGAVRYNNRAEGGARFEVMLPLRRPPLPSADGAPAS